jgi:hypothetical protein
VDEPDCNKKYRDDQDFESRSAEESGHSGDEIVYWILHGNNQQSAAGEGVQCWVIAICAQPASIDLHHD